ncbi:MAG: pyridine nucleotide-disulfide oxidoreductase [Candidatus Zixiibacteriota bacterium]|nr:MAG: pyridine nucleotide-disulfide oxidoreductase [candidate division Zixibacteria bacterium]
MKTRELRLAHVDDLSDGEMKIFSQDGVEVLLVRIDGRYHALGPHCTHYGAPLDQGVLHGERIVCPWHAAQFSAVTGGLVEPPGLNVLPRYEVEIRGGEVIVKVPERIQAGVIPSLGRPDYQQDDRTFAILGAGAAGYSAAQAMREAGYQGRIVLVTREEHAPYDRPTLSKSYLAGDMEPEGLPLRQDSFYADYGIELMLGREAVGVSPAHKEILFAAGQPLAFDKLLIATGGLPRTLNLPGAALDHLFVLRSRVDSDNIIRAAQGTRVAVVGASFIAMEAAAALTKRGLQVTVIAPEAVPFERVFGRDIGGLLQRQHEERGVTFRLSSTVARFEGANRVEAVGLEDGSRVEADLVILGIGVRPATDFLADSFNLQPDGSLEVDEHFRVRGEIYAAGDIATCPDPRTGEMIRIEHWRTAEQQGRHAGFHMAGIEVPYEAVPFFWTSQAGLSLRYLGHAPGWEEVITHGDLDSRRFLAWYVREGRIAAVAGSKRDRDIAALQELMRLDRMPTPDEVRAGEVDILARLEEPIYA